MSVASRSPSLLSTWYSYGSSTPDYEPAQAAFEEGLRIFKEELTKDPSKTSLADQLRTFTLEDVLQVVIQAKNHYADRRGSSKLRDGLAALSRRLLYYGNIVDVLVQHHPEYVSLVWAAMKFLFGAVIEHERTGLAIVTGLSEVANALPRAELAVTIYPTPAMRRAVAMLYAHIVRFLVRAWGYYAESRFTRAVQAITKPAALRYDDIIKMIQQDAQAVASQAASCSQAELRDMHNEIRGVGLRLADDAARTQASYQDLQNRMQSLAETVASFQQTFVFESAVSANAALQIRAALSEMQLMQALAMISSQCSIDHKSVLQMNTQLHSRRRLPRTFNHSGAPLWKLPQLHEWNKSSTSNSILIKSTFHERSHVRGFCTEVIDQLLKSRTAVLWILSDKNRPYSLFDVLKSLVLQAVSLGCSSHPTENQMSFQIRNFLAARFEDDYVKILGDTLQHFKLVYIVTNAEAMSSSTAIDCRNCLRQLSLGLLQHGALTVLKVITTAYGLDQPGKRAPEDLVATVGRMHRRRVKKQMKNRARNRDAFFVRQPASLTSEDDGPVENCDNLDSCDNPSRSTAQDDGAGTSGKVF